MPFEFPTVPVPSTGPALTVLDPGQAPTTILDADQPFSLRIEWSVGGAWIATIGGEWLVRAYAESVGPGVERQLGGPGPTHQGRRSQGSASSRQRSSSRRASCRQSRRRPMSSQASTTWLRSSRTGTSELTQSWPDPRQARSSRCASRETGTDVRACLTQANGSEGGGSSRSASDGSGKG
jgi:hypothetical protein